MLSSGSLLPRQAQEQRLLRSAAEVADTAVTVQAGTAADPSRETPEGDLAASADEGLPEADGDEDGRRPGLDSRGSFRNCPSPS